MIETFFQSAWQVTLELAPWLLLGTVVATVLHLVIPPGLIHRRLRGPGGVLAAVALGVPLPLCSCGVIPAGIGLRRDGASRGAAVGFLISTPQTGVDSVLVSASFLGWPFAFFKLAVAGITGVLGGWLTDLVEPEAQVAPTELQQEVARSRSLSDGLAHGVDILRSIWRWLVIGVLISAAITTFVPNEVFARIADSGALASGLVALVISLPLYVCATASVPIAAALVASGLPAGAALVFLLAGPATNVATVGAIHRTFGRRTLAVYLGTLIVGSLAGGLLFDRVLEGTATMAMHDHGSASPIALLSTFVLLTLIGWFAAQELRAFAGSLGSSQTGTDAGREETHELAVTGINCQNCVRKIETRLKHVDGIRDVTVEIDSGTVRYVGSADEGGVAAVLAEIGYQPAA
jgi:uncharacterized membrane protein YraQ (UPF0718 family)/copper chaperone CopZ